MKTMNRYSLIILLALTMALPATFAQRKTAKTTPPAATNSARGVDSITAAQLKNYLSFIASDEMEGRDTPSRGLDTIAKFIAMNLERWGFKPAGDDGTFFQKIVLRRDQVDGAHSSAEINGTKFNFGDDFLPNAVGATLEGPMVYVGHGWVVKSKNIDAYKGVDVKDKVMVVFGESMPPGLTRADLTGKSGEDYSSPVTYAQAHGARGIIQLPDYGMLLRWDQTRQRFGGPMPRPQVEKFMNQTGPALPVVWISPKMATALFQGEKYSAAALMAFGSGSSPAPVSTGFGPSVTVTLPFELNATKKTLFNVALRTEKPMTQNVIAVWEGSDPVLKSEYVAVGAHYDHVGICAPGQADPICNGADDDGSGTTALLGMAEAVSHAKQRPKRSVLFVWHCGEEKGLWGSRYFTDYPTIPLDHVVAQLNIDMIGRSKKDGDTNPRNATLTGPNSIYVIGSTMMSTELGALSASVNKSYLNLQYDLRYDDPADPNRFFYRSDHFNYARKGIPIIFFFDGVHEDYHRPGDEAQKIDYEKMEKVARTIYLTLWEVASLPARPKVDKPLPAQLTTGRGE
jgi:Peptidase family M28